MAFHIIEEIRKKSQQDWEDLVRDKISNARVWIQENGELASVTAFFSAFIIIFCYKIVLALAAIAFIVGFSLYQLSYPERRESEEFHAHLNGMSNKTEEDFAARSPEVSSVENESVLEDSTDPQ